MPKLSRWFVFLMGFVLTVSAGLMVLVTVAAVVHAGVFTR